MNRTEVREMSREVSRPESKPTNKDLEKLKEINSKLLELEFKIKDLNSERDRLYSESLSLRSALGLQVNANTYSSQYAPVNMFNPYSAHMASPMSYIPPVIPPISPISPSSIYPFDPSKINGMNTNNVPSTNETTRKDNNNGHE